MFKLGFWELIVIAVVVSLLMRPQDLPVILRKIGRTAGRLRQLKYELVNASHKFEEMVMESEKEED